MPDPLTAGYLRSILKANDLSPNRFLGQNFLVSPRAFDEVLKAADVRGENTVLEIGAGVGRLTAMLAENSRHVISVEIDSGLFKVLSERLSAVGNVTLLHCDILEGKHRITPEVTCCVCRIRGGRPVKVVANLPYQVSSPAIINLLEWEVPVDGLYVMLQREVAERLIAGVGTKEYGPLSVFAGYIASARVVFNLPPSAFWPQPEVESSFVHLARRRPPVVAKDYALFSRVVNVLFQNRRKTLRKGLKIGWGGEIAVRTLEKTGVEGGVRPENLEVDGFVRLANALACIS